MTDALQNYIADISLREPAVLRELRETTTELTAATERIMQVSPEQGQFLRLLVRALGVQRAIEVGTFTGYSLVSIAMGLPPGGTVITCDVNAEWSAIAVEYCKRAGVADKVDARVGDARQTLAALQEHARGSFDFVFIDADKEGYETYYEAALELVRSGGLIVVDNVLWHGALLDESQCDSETVALRKFNDRIRDDQRVDLSLIPFADGLTFALKH
ncbi:O-methyltransferase [Amycolatopsis sp. cmx-4-54]|uniref:O-methyltransferase n=1 Tax=Amycolatopsis sp. cmx-4-54 TaxID=2790936 RepID=UPI0039780753